MHSVESTSDFVSLIGKPRMRGLLERVEARQLESAHLLHACGRDDAARRAEQSAARIRLTLDEPRVVWRLFAASTRAAEATSVHGVAEQTLDGAIEIAQAERGNVQIWRPGERVLNIAAHSGFESEFLDYFAVVADGSSACGSAALRLRQTVIADTWRDPRFAPHREIAVASRFRAVQSTPMVDQSGLLRGVISTHYEHIRRPERRELALMQWYADRVGAALAGQMADPVTIEDRIASLRERVAALRAAPLGRAA
jgi:GAF domain-containing protein